MAVLAAKDVKAKKKKKMSQSLSVVYASSNKFSSTSLD
jgi:hypothetical protein